MEAQPSRMFEVLRGCGALAVLSPELDRLWGVPQKAGTPRSTPNPHHAGDRLRRQSWLATRHALCGTDARPGKGLTPTDIRFAHHAHEGARREAR